MEKFGNKKKGDKFTLKFFVNRFVIELIINSNLSKQYSPLVLHKNIGEKQKMRKAKSKEDLFNQKNWGNISAKTKKNSLRNPLKDSKKQEWKSVLSKSINSFLSVSNKNRSFLQHEKTTEIQHSFSNQLKKIEKYSDLHSKSVGYIQYVEWDLYFSKFYSTLSYFSLKFDENTHIGSTLKKYEPFLNISSFPDQLKTFLPFVQLSKIFNKSFLIKYSTQILSFIPYLSWNHLEVALWIHSLKIEEIFRVVKIFIFHDIKGRYLKDLTREDLIEIGINLGNRIRFLNSIQNL